MKARPDYHPDPESSCDYERALHASNVLEQLRPIIGEDRVREIGANPNFQKCDARGRYGSASRSLEETIVTCLENIREVRGNFPTEHHRSGYLNLNKTLKERIDNKLRETAFKLKFAHAIVSIKWGERTQIRVEGRYTTEHLIVSAPYSYAKQIDAGLGQIANKLIGPRSDIEESPDGILTGRVEYAKMDKHHDWFVHDGYLAWMPHDECIKVKALGDDREKAERAARSSARREVLAALRLEPHPIQKEDTMEQLNKSEWKAIGFIPIDGQKPSQIITRYYPHWHEHHIYTRDQVRKVRPVNVRPQYGL